MRNLARRHPIAMTLILLLLSPYILAAVLLYVVAYTIAMALDVIGGRRS